MRSFAVDSFPLLIAAIVVLILVLAIRLDRRLSRGSYSAGPGEVVHPEPPGQEPSPWELRAIEAQLTTITAPGSSVIRHYDLTATVNRLTNAAGLTDARYQLPITATEADLATAVSRIEHQLGLPPLTEGPDDR